MKIEIEELILNNIKNTEIFKLPDNIVGIKTTLTENDIDDIEKDLDVKFPDFFIAVLTNIYDGNYELSPLAAIGFKSGLIINKKNVLNIYKDLKKYNCSNGNKNYFLVNEKILEKYPDGMIPVFLGYEYELVCVNFKEESCPVYFFNPDDVINAENEVVCIPRFYDSLEEFFLDYINGINVYQKGRDSLNKCYEDFGYPYIMT